MRSLRMAGRIAIRCSLHHTVHTVWQLSGCYNIRSKRGEGNELRRTWAGGSSLQTVRTVEVPLVQFFRLPGPADRSVTGGASRNPAGIGKYGNTITNELSRSGRCRRCFRAVITRNASHGASGQPLGQEHCPAATSLRIYPCVPEITWRRQCCATSHSMTRPNSWMPPWLLLRQWSPAGADARRRLRMQAIVC